MIRYTTPTFTLTLPDTVDLTEATNVYAAFAMPGKGDVLRKTGTDLDVTAHQVDVFLSQEETALFRPGTVLIQLNWTYQDGGIAKRAGSEIATINVTPNLINEVLT